MRGIYINKKCSSYDMKHKHRPASSVSVSSGDLMAAESVMSLRASSASLRKSQWSLRGR